MTTMPDLSRELAPDGRSPSRRALVEALPGLNGIDYVEFERRGIQQLPVLVVRMLSDLPVLPASPVFDLDLKLDLVVIAGGSRVRAIRALKVTEVAPRTLEFDLSAEGDFSTYWVGLGWQREPAGGWMLVRPGLDRIFSIAPFSFKAGCTVEFDCAVRDLCAEPPGDAPVLDYLAKDYASFRQLCFDLITQRHPDWIERSPADLGMTLVELLSYAGDRLSYFQDAVATEAYLGSARQRVSAKRHARLVDYRMHDGRNAWTAVHVRTDGQGDLPAGTRILGRILHPLQGQAGLPLTVIPSHQLTQAAFDDDPALQGVPVFETSHDVVVLPLHNELWIHAWGNNRGCLVRGTTRAQLFAVGLPVLGVRPTSLPLLQAGDFLLLEEVRGPGTGAPADADPAHRMVVRITAAANIQDPAFTTQVVGDQLQPRGGGPPLDLLEVEWAPAEALRFPVCLSAIDESGALIRNVSVARGNMALVDHGRTVDEQLTVRDARKGSDLEARGAIGMLPLGADERLVLPLRRGPVSQARGPVGGFGLVRPPRVDLTGAPGQMTPWVQLTTQIGAQALRWDGVRSLLASAPTERHFVVDVDNEGVARLRFGDDVYGMRPTGAVQFNLRYRIGNGRVGNVGAEALFHVEQPAAAVNFPAIAGIRNPIAARGGTEPETVEQVRRFAPAAFRADQLRAVTAADYAEKARGAPDVAGAQAEFRWTGSWYTVFVAVDPARETDLVFERGGRARLQQAFARRVLTHLDRFRLAGYDLELRAAEYAPLEMHIALCVCGDYFRPDVVEAVIAALSSRQLDDGALGFFHSSRWTFGDPVYLSQVYSAIESVAGVDSAEVTTFRRFGRDPAGELESGVISIGLWEIARLDNDPSFMESGVLKVRAGGGK